MNIFETTVLKKCKVTQLTQMLIYLVMDSKSKQKPDKEEK